MTSDMSILRKRLNNRGIPYSIKNISTYQPTNILEGIAKIRICLHIQNMKINSQVQSGENYQFNHNAIGRGT